MHREKMVREYLQALGLEDQRRDLEFLNEINRRHVATFAFSSVGCRLGEDLSLDFASLFERIVLSRRGGYCFEQNGLMFEILEELGFEVELYLARVVYNQDTHPGLTHRVTLVELEGRKYIMDVGFGPLGPRVLVDLSGSETEDGARIFRLAQPGAGEYHMQVLRDGVFFTLYRFELSRYGQADCELGHFYSHKHPNAAFVNHLVVSLILDQETRSLRDLDYWVISDSGTRQQDIGTPEQLERILVEDLGVRVTAEEGRRLYGDLMDRGKQAPE